MRPAAIRVDPTSVSPIRYRRRTAYTVGDSHVTDFDLQGCRRSPRSYSHSSTTGSLRSLAVPLAVLGFALTATVSATATQHADDRAFVVDLATDGSATVRVHHAYDLDPDEEWGAFRETRGGDTLQRSTARTSVTGCPTSPRSGSFRRSSTRLVNLSVSAIVRNPSSCRLFCRWLSDNRNPVTAWGRFTRTCVLGFRQRVSPLVGDGENRNTTEESERPDGDLNSGPWLRKPGG